MSTAVRSRARAAKGAVSTAAVRSRVKAGRSPIPNTPLSDMLDEVRAGARLILSYDSTANAFNGTVENTTGATLRRVRVEVHLSNGIELGPTTPVDMAPGQVIEVALPGSSQPFTSWSAHPEAG